MFFLASELGVVVWWRGESGLGRLDSRGMLGEYICSELGYGLVEVFRVL